jgi:hypothetical protein
MADPVIQHVPSTPESLGQKTSAASLPVVLASDQSLTLDPGGIATEAKQDVIIAALARLPGSLVPVAYDYIAYTSGATNDVYVYKTGGSGGTTVKTVTITYTDASKAVLSSVAAT